MKPSRLLWCLLLFYGSTSMAQKAFHQWAQTPPMGWNSYNSFGSAVREDEVKANTDYMARHLKPHGWQYVVVDYLWSFPSPPGSTVSNANQYRFPDGAYVPWLNMDSNGRLLPDEKKFPSAWAGKGFKPLADYIHAAGLKFGIHVMRGIPRQAVWAKSPILGAPGITADAIADTASICTWVNHMYGLNMAARGAQEYLNSLLQLYASWGVDFIKVDDISQPYHAAEIEGYRKAIDNCGRPIVLSLSPGETPVQQALHVAKQANLWRLSNDFWDNWPELVHMFDYAKRWQGVAGPGHWPDCDMMQIGKLSKRGPVGPERYSRFTEPELYTHMTLWSIARSPLMVGGNLPENRELELKLLTNDEVLAVNQQGEAPRLLSERDSTVIWVSKRKGKGWNVALFNLNSTPHNVAVDFSALGIKGSWAVRDLWKQQDIGVFKKKYGTTLPAHGAALYTFSP